MSKLWNHFVGIVVERMATFRQQSKIKVEFSNGTVSEFFAAAVARVCDHATRIVNLAVSTIVSQGNHESRFLVMLGAGTARAHTLPNATGSGSIYRFIVGAVNAQGYTIKSNRGADVMKGQVVNTNSGSAGAARGWYPGATDDTITLNGATSGGANVGDWIELVDVGLNTWIVNGLTTGTGTVITPFSDTVA